MFKSYLLTLCLFVGTWTVCSASLTPEEAIQRFRLNHCQNKADIRSSDSSLNLVYTHCYKGKPSVYFFNRQGEPGFVILSANGEKDVLLGYGANDTISIQDIPEMLKILFNKNRHVMDLSSEANKRPVISPMLTTNWNQTEPYNNTLPVQYGDKSRAGCVATAMAQLINYHRFPIQPTGSREYTSVLWHYSVDFSDYMFDFDNMIDNYQTCNPTEKQLKAVNDLFYCCGMSVDSEWGTDVTTAKVDIVPERMNNHFHYSDAMGIVNSSRYTVEEWTDLIYAQLERGLPVILSANSGDKSIGHAFICDGYDGNGYYHINWGWGGALDGFYNPTSLYSFDPDVDFSSEGFSINLQAIINIFPEDRLKNPVTVFEANSFSLLEQSFDFGDKVEVNCNFQQCAGLKRPVKLGLRFENINTGKIIYSQSNEVEEFDKGVMHWQWSQNLPTAMEAGTYKVTPAAHLCDANEWVDVNISLDVDRFYLVEVDDSKIKFIKPSEKGSITLKNAVYPEALFYKKTFSASADLVNNSECDYFGYIALCVFTKSEEGSYRIVAKSPTVPVNIGKDDSRSVFLSGEFSWYDGEYLIGFMTYPKQYDNIGTPLGEPQNISVEEYVPGTLVVDEIALTRESDLSNSMLSLTAMFRCEKGYYNGEIFMDLVECNENGEPLEPLEEVNITESGHTDVGQIINSVSPDDSFSKQPQSPKLTIGRRPYPVKITRKTNKPTKKYNSESHDHYERLYIPRYYYRKSSDSDDLIYLLIPLLLMEYLLSTDVPETHIENVGDANVKYYNLDGVGISSTPTSPGVYVKVTSDSNCKKAQKVIIK